MISRIIFVFIASCTLTVSNIIIAQEELALATFYQGQRSYQQYMVSQGIDQLEISRECNEDGSQCWPVIVNENNKTLSTFTNKDRVSPLASGQYANISYLLVNLNGSLGGLIGGKHILISSDGQRSSFNVPESIFKNFLNWLDLLVSPEGHLIVLTRTGLTTINKQGEIISTAPSPQPLSHGKLSSQADGSIAIIAVTKEHEVILGGLNELVSTQVYLSKYSDRKGILSVYPHNNKVHAVIYNYTNEYCKGLYYVGLDNKSPSENKAGWIFNSTTRNIGWSPSIYVENGHLTIGTTNSSSNNPVYMTIPLAELNAVSDHFEGSQDLCKEKSGSLLLGVGISHVSWIAKSEVKWKGNSFMTVDYNISDSLSKLVQFEGRFSDTRLTLSFMENEAISYGESQGGKPSGQAAKWLYALVDIDGLLPYSSSLRLVMEQSIIDGVAEVTQDSVTSSVAFSSKYLRLATLVMRERGTYLGLQYEKFKMPSAIGFAPAIGGPLTQSYFDSGLGIQRLSIVLGHDALSYAKRYETNISRRYWAGELGFGAAWLDISNKIKNDAKAISGKNDIEIPVSTGISAMLELGYLKQMRIQKFNGLGLTFNTGYRIRGSEISAGRDKDDSDKSGKKLQLVFERYDIYHGPFAQLSLIW